MATLTIWWGSAEVQDADKDKLPLIPLPGAAGVQASAQTMTSIGTSTASTAAPNYGQPLTPCTLLADGGDVWVTTGETASANGANCVLLKTGMYVSAAVAPGTTIKAIQVA